MKIKKKIKKIQTPIEYDCHFKYKCPDPNCGYDYWISLKQACTKNFKIVCDCGIVFKPKRIKKIKPIYFQDSLASDKTTKKSDIDVSSEEPIEVVKPEIKEIDQNLLSKAVKILIGYGFTSDEAKELLIKSYRKFPEPDCVKLIKYTLENMGA